MTEAFVSRIVMFIFVIIAALYITVDVLLSKNSTIGSSYLYLALILTVISIMYPRKGMYLAAIFTCYVDLFKRLMILGGLPTELELAYIQATPMLLVCGSAVAVFLPFFKGYKLKRESIVSLIIAVAIIGILVAAGGSTGGAVRQIGQAVNMGVYALMLFSIPLIFKTADDQKKYLRFCFFCFIPVALYMIKHYFFGLADFEYDYMITGLSQEVRIFTVDGDARRYFSTLNSGATVSTMLSVMCLYALVNTRDATSSRGFVVSAGYCIVVVIFVYAAFLTLSRTGLVCGLVAAIAYFFFGSKIRVMSGYLVAFFVFFLLVATADTILRYRLLDEWQIILNDYFLKKSGDASTERALILGTMYDRLSGWRYLATQPLGFPLFGTAFGGELNVKQVDSYLICHDLVVHYLIRLGWIPMFFLSLIMTIFLRKLHQFQFSIDKKTLESKLIRYALASALGILSGGMANGAQLMNFPQNFYLWLWLSICLASYNNRDRKQTTEILPAGSIALA